MSYMAEVLMKQAMSPEEYQRNVYGTGSATAAPQAAAVDPVVQAAKSQATAPASVFTPEAADEVEKERRKLAAVGESGDMLLLGGPRQKIGG